MLNWPKTTTRQLSLFQLLSWCHATKKGENSKINSKCSIRKTKNATGPKTGKIFTSKQFFYLVSIKISEHLAALILERVMKG